MGGSLDSGGIAHPDGRATQFGRKGETARNKRLRGERLAKDRDKRVPGHQLVTVTSRRGGDEGFEDRGWGDLANLVIAGIGDDETPGRIDGDIIWGGEGRRKRGHVIQPGSR